MTKVEILEDDEVVKEESQLSSENTVIMPQLTPAHTCNKIILNLMIKNESKIIERCLGHALPHVDAVSILDTGSTDNTVALCEAYLTKSGKPFTIAVEPFKNFGYNRTVSFEKTQAFCTKLGWDAEKTYAMAVDADMNIVVSPSFKGFPLTANGYTVIQANGSIKYDNTRFMKVSKGWKCVGSSHEYWDFGGTSRIPYEVIFIDDKNDGGSKADKFERDVRLLTEDIIENPKNDRAHYYLGQSLKDLGRFQEAIEMFTRRIELGGWIEEVHYAHYQIGKCYDHMGKPHEMELWMNKAFDYYPKKAEPIYFLTKYFREKSQHYKAYHYYLKGKDIPFPKDDVLFIENMIYEGLFAYEATILDCYVTGKSKQNALTDLVSYINRKIPHHTQNVWDNLVYYLEPLTSKTYKGEYSRLLIKDHDQYKVSSCCLVPYSNDPNKRFALNTRYVNYGIDPNGYYKIRDADGKVKTKNGRIFLNAAYQPTGEVSIMSEDYQCTESNIEGMEDVRIFFHQGRLQFMASSKNITTNGYVVIAQGDYDAEQCKMTNIKVIESPRNSDCEKNWIYVPNNNLVKVDKAPKDRINVIYGWSPFEIGAVNPTNNKLEIHTTYPSNEFFRHCRGSSPLVEHEGKMWATVHFVKYSQPRIYYHSVVQFHRETMRPERFSAPFVFCDTKIEYCMGFHIKGETACFIFSRNDTDASMIQVPLANLQMLPIA